MTSGYGEEEGKADDPLILKSQFVMSLCEQLMKPEPVGAKERSIIGRCVGNVYREYIKDYRNPPTLKDFREELLRQPEPQAQSIALALELFVDGTLDVFAYQTNVDMSNRIMLFDIFDLGSQLKTVGMLVMLDAILNRVIENHKRGRRTWIYIDEIYLFFANEYSSNFLEESWKRFRKKNAAATGITQNVTDCLRSPTAKNMLANSEFLLMLSQAPTDQQELVKMLRISEEQLSYNEAHSAEEVYREFNQFANSLILQRERRKTISRTEEELKKIRKVLADWPELEKVLARAQTLHNEKTTRELLDKYNAATEIVNEINTLSLVAANTPCPTASEIAQVKTAQRNIASLENKLCGMNLTAAVHMFGGNTLEVISVRTGQKIDVSDGIANISEAVRLTIPGVMEMQLSPADVDVASVEAQIKTNKQLITDIFKNYQVENLEALEALAQTIAENTRQLDLANNRLKQLLGATTFEELERTIKSSPQESRSKAEIENDIAALCGNSDLSRFITAKETVISSYKAEYTSANDLKAKAFDLDAELNRAMSATENENIPAEYREIADPEAHLLSLQNVCKQKQKLRETALTLKTAAESKLESYKENIADDPSEEAEKATRKFEEQKSLLSHWLHIFEVFKSQKENIHDNPMQDIADSFSHYLRVISDGRVSSEFPETDRLAMQVYSNDLPLDYGKLSEGTKETVSLAFRLAVLDHLFPDGGGVIVLDDPFTDMDSERTNQACKLVKECAKQHQVIFMTCREEYIQMLGGNTIKL